MQRVSGRCGEPGAKGRFQCVVTSGLPRTEPGSGGRPGAEQSQRGHLTPPGPREATVNTSNTPVLGLGGSYLGHVSPRDRLGALSSPVWTHGGLPSSVPGRGAGTPAWESGGAAGGNYGLCLPAASLRGASGLRPSHSLVTVTPNRAEV